MRTGHPRYAKRLSLKAFLEIEHAVVHAEGRSHELFEKLLERRRIRRKIALHTPHFLSIPIIVSRSDLMATVPHALALYFGRLAPRNSRWPCHRSKSQGSTSSSIGTASSTTTRATSGCADGSPSFSTTRPTSGARARYSEIK